MSSLLLSQRKFSPQTRKFNSSGREIIVAPDAIPPDQYYNLTTLLLPGNGTNGAQNNTFLDSSTNNFSITRNGNTTQGTFSPFSQTGWSNYFDGTGDYLDIAHNSALTPSGDFTIEFWAYSFSSSGIQEWYSKGYGIQIYVASGAWAVALSANNNATYFMNEGNISVVTNKWTHIAVTRSGNSYRFFIDGVQSGSTITSASAPSTGTDVLRLGDWSGGTGYAITGYMSNVRFVNGTGLYTSAFTPPTTQLTAITGTSLLTCQSNRLIDNSSNAFTITRNGDTSVQTFSPFAPTAEYSAAAVGGSGYFDGSGDYLSGPQNAAFAFGTGSFTVEFFVYTTSTAAQMVFDTLQPNTPGGGSNRFYVYIKSDQKIVTGPNTQELTSTGTIQLGVWTHVAVVRNGTTRTIYINGVASGSDTSNNNLTENYCTIGLDAATNGTISINGYLSNLRVVKGTAAYTANFTPPTSPLTATAGTSLLLNFTNAGITDSTSKNILETLGNSQISTVQSRFGGSSMLFDGTGDYLYVPSSINCGYGTGAFTIEFWLYLNTIGVQTIISHLSSNPQVKPHIYYSSGIRLYVNGADVITGGTVPISTWTHIALSRNATSTRLFINGTQSGSTYSDSNNYGASSPLIIGDYGVPVTGSNMLNGYIDDLRITRGFARYTANFTPPTTAFPTQ